MSDVNWLLATIAQSSAALVAIVGGFLISRIVGLASDRDALIRQLRRTEQELGAKEGQRTGMRGELARMYALDFFMDGHNDLLLEAPMHSVAREAVERGPHVDERTAAEIERLAERARALRERLAPLFVDGQDAPSDVDLERGPASDAHPIVLHAVRRDLKRRHRPPTRTVLGATIPTMPELPPTSLAFNGPTRADAEHETERDLERLEAEIDVLTTRRDDLAENLAGLAVPDEFGQGVSILSFLAMVGIAAPVVMMLFGKTQLPLLATIPLVTLFIIGVVVLLVFLYESGQRLGRFGDHG